MYVEVVPMNSSGRALTAAERKAAERFRGVLQLTQEYSHAMGRSVLTARLYSRTASTPTEQLPALADATVLHIREGRLRLRGAERIGAAEYVQTWDVKVDAC